VCSFLALYGIVYITAHKFSFRIIGVIVGEIEINIKLLLNRVGHFRIQKD
jgi:hypothetical protein